jgi:hypothetical protein
MYYEIRTYRIKTGALPVYLKLVEEEGIALQKQYLGELVGYFYSEIGPLNQIVHIWAYPSLDEREARRTAWQLTRPGWHLPRKSRLCWKKWKARS